MERRPQLPRSDPFLGAPLLSLPLVWIELRLELVRIPPLSCCVSEYLWKLIREFRGNYVLIVCKKKTNPHGFVVVFTLYVHVCAVGSEWNVLYITNPTKKVKKFFEGVLRLVQRNREQQKVCIPGFAHVWKVSLIRKLHSEWCHTSLFICHWHFYLPGRPL
jgi:hypothetical protein